MRNSVQSLSNADKVASAHAVRGQKGLSKGIGYVRFSDPKSDEVATASANINLKSEARLEVWWYQSYEELGQQCSTAGKVSKSANLKVTAPIQPLKGRLQLSGKNSLF